MKTIENASKEKYEGSSEHMYEWMGNTFGGLAQNVYEDKKGVIILSNITIYVNDFDGYCENQEIESSKEFEERFNKTYIQWEKDLCAHITEFGKEYE